MLADVREASDARCARGDVDPEWWMDPDDSMSGKDKESWHERQTRAQLLCYKECPLLGACREAGWGELWHVWGGMTASERFRARKSGFYSPDRSTPLVPPGEKTRAVETSFLNGDSKDIIAATLNLRVGTVTYYLGVALRHARDVRERQYGWEQQALPPVPDWAKRRGHLRSRNGQASSKSCLPDSA